MKYSFITQHKNTFSIRLMCQVLGVSRNAYYHYQRSQKNTDPMHAESLYWVKRIAKDTDYTYGSRRMKHALRALSFPVSRQKARKLMKEAGVKVLQRKKYKVTTNSNHNMPVYETCLIDSLTSKRRIRFMPRISLICGLRRAGYTWL